ncbi:MAG: YDG/SRA domain-containing protein [Acidobacteriota bacterium]|nr:YDG/SRA domain-containing protein [Acidobacteriota bacterium]
MMDESVASVVKMSGEKVKNCLSNEYFLEEARIGDIFSWSQVREIHKTRHGIYQRNERLISLLTDFGKINQCYPDFHGDSTDTIFYTGAGRRGDQKLDSFNRAMFNAIETKHTVPLFNKQSVGRWELLGFWRVAEGRYIFDKAQDRMIWKFKLERF